MYLVGGGDKHKINIYSGGVKKIIDLYYSTLCYWVEERNINCGGGG